MYCVNNMNNIKFELKMKELDIITFTRYFSLDIITTIFIVYIYSFFNYLSI